LHDVQVLASKQLLQFGHVTQTWPMLKYCTGQVVLSQLLLNKTFGDVHLVQLLLRLLHYEQGEVHELHTFPIFLKVPERQLARQVLLVR